MKTTLLLGSGVSLYSDIPGLSAITKSLLNDKNIGKGTDLNYYYNGHLGYTIQEYLNGYVERCQQLMNHVSSIIERFHKHVGSESTANYEEIYYLLRQIQDSYHHEFENPATISLIEELLSETTWSVSEFKDVVVESCRFIESIVWQAIDKTIHKTSQFNIIHDLIREGNLDTIISLNHDLVLEDWLKTNGIQYDDGFHMTDLKFPEWTGYKNQPGDLKVCKVHGSIDWFEFRINRATNFDNLIKVPRNHYVELLYQTDSWLKAPNSGKPSILIGTFNKMLGYLSDIYEILFNEFKSVIEASEMIIISGYGFGDKGINTRLMHWLYQAKSRKMIIIHPNLDSLIENSRGSFKLNISSGNHKHPKVEIIEKPFEEVTIDEISKASL